MQAKDDEIAVGLIEHEGRVLIALRTGGAQGAFTPGQADDLADLLKLMARQARSGVQPLN